MRHLPAAAALFALGCGEGERVDLRHVPLPSGSAPAYVLRVDTVDGAELYALDPFGSAAVEIDETRLLNSAPYLAVGLDQFLGELGLAPGLMPASADIGLNIFRSSTSLEVWAPTAGQWQLSSRGLPDDMTEYALGARCTTWQARDLFKGLGNARFIVPIDDEHVMVGLDSVNLVVTATAATPIPDVQLGRPRALTPQSAVAAQGWIWLTDARGYVHRSPQQLPLAFERVMDAPAAFTLGGTPAPDGTGLFLVGRPEGFRDPRPIYRGDRGAWTQIGEVASFEGGPVATGLDQAYLRSGAVGVVYQLSSQGVRSEDIGARAFESLASVEPYGIVAGTVDGRAVVRDSEGNWRQLPGKEFGWWMVSLAQYRDGFMGLLATGTLVEYVRNTPCTDQSFRGVLNFGEIAPLGDGLIMATSIDVRAEVIFLAPDR